MCLIVFAYKHHPGYPLIVAANRDEFYARPTEPAGLWEDFPQVLAGRDLKNGGTWMGITREGRFAAMTNYREAGSHRIHAPSRGCMVRDFLVSARQPRQHLKDITEIMDRYNGFNLILGDLACLYYCSNRKNGPEEIRPGVHTLSNHLLDTPWPKSIRSREAFTRVIESGRRPDHGLLMEILLDRTPAGDGELPDTGFGKSWERMLSPVFIVSDTYGTRNSTVLLVDSRGRVSLEERSFNYPGDPGKRVTCGFDLPGHISDS